MKASIEIFALLTYILLGFLTNAAELLHTWLEAHRESAPQLLLSLSC